MASILTGTLPWHAGEQKIHSLLHVPLVGNPTVPGLAPGAGTLVKKAPLLALGTLDDQGRPWTTVWNAEGSADPLSESTIEAKSLVDSRYDPVVEAVAGGDTDKMVSALSIDLETRRRVKLYGRTISALLSHGTAEPTQARLTVKIETSLGGWTLLRIGLTQQLSQTGNCPKYLNKKHIVPAVPNPKLISDSPHLTPGAVDLLNSTDCFFISSFGKEDMDTNNRNGPPGFVRVFSNNPSGAVLVYPEYSGNRLYQTLGNLQINPMAGYVFPDFKTGNALYATGHTEILIGKDASAVIPRSNLAVRVTISAARYVENSLSFRGIPGQPSPYTPSVRYLATEKEIPAVQGSDDLSVTATLIKKEEITPTIYRFRFRISDPAKLGPWIPGQYVILSFQEELDMGYSHMRDDDPTSLNDDYVRTFTISSYPERDLRADEFEVTARKKGNVTSYISRVNERAGLDVPLMGFGGSFHFEDRESETGVFPFIAGGVGLTPLLAQLPGIDVSRLKLFWSVNARDIGLVLDTFRRFPDLPASSSLFVTGADDGLDRERFKDITLSKATIERRRMIAGDIDPFLAEIWYLCAPEGLKRTALNWLTGRRVVYEDFEY